MRNSLKTVLYFLMIFHILSCKQNSQEEKIIEKSKINVPTVMQELAKRGEIAEDEMFGTFNMGVGMVVIVDQADAEKVVNIIDGSAVIGEIQEGSDKIILK